MDLEEIKKQWSGLNSGITNPDTTISNKKFENMATAQQQLISQYRTFAGLAAVFFLFTFVIFTRLFDNVWMEFGIAAFFATCATMDFVLQRKVGEISLTTMSVTEVARKAAACRRLHHIFQLILIPSGIALLICLAYSMTDNKAFIYGMCIGAVIGLAFGIKGYLQFMNNYKSLIKK